MKSPEFSEPDPGELQALRRVLNASAPATPLHDLQRERIRARALSARLQRQKRGLALAASVLVLTASLPLLNSGRPPTPPLNRVDDTSLLQDPLLTELDLLDLKLLELSHAFDFDLISFTPEDFR